MNAIRRLIGDLTYYELQKIDPNVFPALVQPSLHKSDHTDIIVIFMDTDYTPQLLLEDFKRIISGRQPINEEAYKFVITRPGYTLGWEPNFMEFIIFVIISLIFWLATFHTLMVIFLETPTLYRLTIPKSIIVK